MQRSKYSVGLGKIQVNQRNAICFFVVSEKKHVFFSLCFFCCASHALKTFFFLTCNARKHREVFEQIQVNKRNAIGFFFISATKPCVFFLYFYFAGRRARPRVTTACDVRARRRADVLYIYIYIYIYIYV